jgi:hypothetical protein
MIGFIDTLYSLFGTTGNTALLLICCEGMFTELLHSKGSYLIISCVFVALEMCLLSRCLAMNVYSDFAIPGSGVMFGDTTNYTTTEKTSTFIWKNVRKM